MSRSFIFSFAKTITKSFFRKPATLMYPYKERKYYPITRGRIFNDIERCIFCGICARKCPTHAITVMKETKEYELRSLQCISCGACVEVCPPKCLSMEIPYSVSVSGRNEGVYYYRQAEKKKEEPAAGE
jgi:formate hydrogenlyase subunit 6/NADH:ubiquinone oxidoreductase subunit I